MGGNNKYQNPNDNEPNEFYEVEAIRDKRILAHGELEYKIKWSGYGEPENTWEPISNLQSCIKMVHDFDEHYDKKKKMARRSEQGQSNHNNGNGHVHPQMNPSNTSHNNETGFGAFNSQNKSRNKQGSIPTMSVNSTIEQSRQGNFIPSQQHQNM